MPRDARTRKSIRTCRKNPSIENIPHLPIDEKHSPPSRYREQRKRRRMEIRTESIFPSKRTRTSRGQLARKISKSAHPVSDVSRVRKLAARAKGRRLGIDRRALKLVEPGQRSSSLRATVRVSVGVGAATTKGPASAEEVVRRKQRRMREGTALSGRTTSASTNNNEGFDASTTATTTTNNQSTSIISSTDLASSNNQEDAVVSVVDVRRDGSKNSMRKRPIDFEVLTECGLQSYTKLPA